MSTEIDSPQLARSRKKKLKEKYTEKKDKKRKRHTSDDLELPSPTKKRRSTHHSKSPVVHIAPQTQFESPVSAFYKQTSSLYLPLPPISQTHALQGLCAEYLSPLILTYYPPLHGVIISYSNASLSSDPDPESKPAYARAVDEYAASFVWLTVDFVVFKPQKGNVIEGWINLQNESNIGLLCLNFFNATIERKRLASGWKWISGGMKPPRKRRLKVAAKGADAESNEDKNEDEEASGGAEEYNLEDAQGYFQDAQGEKVEGLIRFKVKDLEISRSMDRESVFLNIVGTMLNDKDEKALQEEEATRVKERGKKRSTHAMTGALANDSDGSMEVDRNGELTAELKHRGNR